MPGASCIGAIRWLQRQAVVEEEVEDGEVEDAVGVAFGGGEVVGEDEEVVGEDDAGEVIVEEAQGTALGGAFLGSGHGEGGLDVEAFGAA